MTRVLVTGGAGFISSNLCRHLLRATDHEVVIMDALTYAGNMAQPLGPARPPAPERSSRATSATPTHVERVVAGVDQIVNAAAESHVEKSILEGASEFVTTNVEGTQVLLDAIRRHPVERFVLISSSEVYGTAERDPMDEEHPLNPRSPYAATKAGGDRLVYRYVATYGLPCADHPAVQQLRPVPASREGHPALHHGGAARRAADGARRRHGEPRLAARRGRLPRHHGGAARADRGRARRGDQRRDRGRRQRERASRAVSATSSASPIR